MAEGQNYFARQKLIPDFSQEALTGSTALLLGMGGLGTNVATALCRLGVGKMFIVDYDVVDDHNLNRQTLFKKSHVNKSKVESSLETLQELHNLVTEIIPVEIDVLKNWPKVVELAKQSTIIFNMIDIGDSFDYAVQSLALSLRVPLSLGGTFQSTATVDFFKPGGNPCLACVNDNKFSKEILDKLTTDKIQSIQDISFLPADDNPTGQSTFLVANQCANMMAACFLNDLLKQSDPPTRSIFYLSDFQSLAWPMEPRENCELCAKSNSVV
mmetsp:Transcript_406/g.540  ORF Transcript_406/g.540 Transcript_406/m.540 type:complete len:270 (+) Transcript_406:676-1485(+)